MKKLFFFVYFFLTISNLFSKDNGVNPLRKSIYIIAVGIDNYTEFSDLNYAVSDTKKFLQLFESIRLPTHVKRFPNTSNSISRSINSQQSDTFVLYKDTVVYKKFLINSNASKDSIKSAFQDVANKAKSGDVFVFYYAGMAFTQFINNNEYPFLLTGEYNLNQNNIQDKSQTSKNTIYPWELNSWLNQIQCKKQLVVSDACSSKSFFNVLFKSNDTNTMNIEKRERIFIGAIGLVQEYSEINGAVLTYSLSNIPDSLSILELYDENKRWRIEYEISKNIINLDKLINSKLAKFEVFYESDIIKYQNLVCKKKNIKRGSNPFSPLKDTNQKEVNKQVKNYALIVGTDSYDEFSQLNNPVLDAVTIEKELSENYNFQTILLKNPTKSEIETALYKISMIELDSTSQLLIFFAGHGIYDETTKDGYIVPKDAKKNDNLFRNSYISHSNIRNIIDGFNSQHTLVILDICFGGTFNDKLSRNAEDDQYKEVEKDKLILRKMEYKSRLYLTSGGKEYVPDGRMGYHSPFASKFIDFLRKGNSIYTFSALKSHVEKISPEPKAGSFGTNEPGGDFLFIHN